MSLSSRNPVEALADEFAARLRAGEQPTIEEYTTAHPEWADDIRELFPMLGVLEKVALESAEESSSDTRDDLVGRPLGDFRLLGVIGRGGMGVVYEAVQEPLGRHVAVKILPQGGMLDPKYRERFRREARAGAMLHHTNIVPIFDFGECDGVYYYAMQFIDGRSLDEVLRELRWRHRQNTGGRDASDAERPQRDDATQLVVQTIVSGDFGDSVRLVVTPRPPELERNVASPGPSSIGQPPDVSKESRGSPISADGIAFWRNVARIGLQVAEALAYAHSHGVLHRDIKPANVLLDTKGTVWVTDFGLAKTTDEHRLTETGDIVGTLRYMSPEALSGGSDTRSDICALGLTLYELAALEPAYADLDRGRLIQSILSAPPRELTKARQGVPRDLAVIIHKAISRQPADRYASAEDLADDLRRFLQNEPISARRISLPARLVRWAQRNRAVAALTAVLAILMTGGFIAACLTSVRLHHLADQRRIEMQRAQAAELQSLQERAEALLVSQRPGQRSKTLKSVRQALQLAKRLDHGDQTRLRLRNLAIAAMRLPDIQPDTQHRVDCLAYEDTGVCFSADLSEFAAQEQGPYTNVVRSVQDSAVLRSLAEPVVIRAFDETGRWLAVSPASTPNELSILDQTSLRPVVEGIRMPSVGRTLTHGLAFDRTGDHLAIGTSDGTVAVYELPSGRQLAPLAIEDRETVTSFHPTRTWLAVGCLESRTMKIIDYPTGRRIHERGLPEPPVALAWRPDGRFLAIAAGHDVHVLNCETWDLQHDLRGHSGQVAHVEYHPAGRLLATHAWDQSIRLWEPLSARALLRSNGRLARFNRQGNRVALLSKTDATIHRVDAGTEFQSVRVTDAKPLDPWVVDPDARWLVANSHRGPKLCDLNDVRILATLPAKHEKKFFIDDVRKWLYAGGPGAIQRWPVHVEDGGNRVTLGKREDIDLSAHIRTSAWIEHMSFAAGKIAALTAGDGKLIVLNASRDDEPMLIDVPRAAAWLDVSPDARWAVVGNYHGRTVEVYDLTTSRRIFQWVQARAFPRFSPNGRWLAISGGRRVQIIDTRTWTVHAESRDLPIEKGMPFFFADSRSLAAPIASPPGIVLLDTDSAAELAVLPADPDAGYSVCWGASPDGRRVITRDGDAIVGIWDLVQIRERLGNMGLDWPE